MRLRVLTYHRVGRAEEDPSLYPRLISASPETFARQMQHLRRHYAPVSMEEVLAAADGQRDLPRRAVLVTFDDAYHDFVDWAWPTLRSLQVPATMFVPTSYPDAPERSFWHDRLHWSLSRTARPVLELPGLEGLPLATPGERGRSVRALMAHLKTLPHEEGAAVVDRICRDLGEERPVRKSVLTWDQLRALAAEGLTLGAHSQTHPLLTRVTAEVVRREAVGARRDLARETGVDLPIFCYPSGAHDDTVVSVLAGEGFALAFTTLDGHNRLGHTHPLRLRRTNLTPRTTPFVFGLRLQAWASLLDAWRHGQPVFR